MIFCEAALNLLWSALQINVTWLEILTPVRWVEAHHRGGNHTQGHPARLWHVPAPTAEPPAGLRLSGGLPGDLVSSVQVPRAVRQAPLALAARAQIFTEITQLAQEVTDGRFSRRCRGGGGARGRRWRTSRRQTLEHTSLLVSRSCSRLKHCIDTAVA